MSKRWFHILLLVLLLVLPGCVDELAPDIAEDGFNLTIRCKDPLLTKASPPDGEQQYNENLIKSVDFFFYPGDAPAATQSAVLHIRKEASSEITHTFKLVLKKSQFGSMFDTQYHKSTVYALVNFDQQFIDKVGSHPSLQSLAQEVVKTDFLQETDFVQPAFLMDGKKVITYDPDHPEAAINETIEVTRFATKLTMGVNVTPSVTLHHYSPDPNNILPDEVWTPVLHTMRLYLVDGVNTVQLGLVNGETTVLPCASARVDPPHDTAYFAYKTEEVDHSRPFLRDDNTPYVGTTTVDGTTYYDTYPMYTYPRTWSVDKMNYQNDYSNGMPHEAPYFKLEMDWRREPENGYSYDRRKYYYKVYMPFNEFKRNSWYGFYLDVSILGSETDEGNAVLEPTCYLLDWQNKALAINKYAVISKARYLEVEKNNWDVNNMEELVIPFISSHNVAIVPGTIEATRPYYGTDTTSLPRYDDKKHAWIKRNNADGTFYLDYNGQPSGSEKWEPSNWIIPQSTSIRLDHPLVNDNTKDDFDYSVYTIEFDIVHKDLLNAQQSHTYSQYVRHIKIVQRPGIYIDRLRNSDTKIRKRDPNDTKEKTLHGYDPLEDIPWTNYPWGYVYVNGGRFIRHDTKSINGKEDRYYSLSTDNNKKEYQWQTVWYTGGSRDIFDIHCTVLPSSSTFVIGDPRTATVDNLTDPYRYAGLYIFEADGPTSEARFNDLLVLETVRANSEEYPDGRRVGFNKADALFGDPYRSLQWYYPTERSSRTENMVAPSYRISSKFSGIEFEPSLTLPYAEYRCAAFQEDGFPAGRWRLPTKAEVHFIAQLSAKKFFEFLFNDGGVYWSANGAIKISGSSVVDVTNQNALLRCVYDSWYWDKVDGLEGDPRHNPRDKFVWGDMER